MTTRVAWEAGDSWFTLRVGEVPATEATPLPAGECNLAGEAGATLPVAAGEPRAVDGGGVPCRRREVEGTGSALLPPGTWCRSKRDSFAAFMRLPLGGWPGLLSDVGIPALAGGLPGDTARRGDLEDRVSARCSAMRSRSTVLPMLSHACLIIFIWALHKTHVNHHALPPHGRWAHTLKRPARLECRPCAPLRACAQPWRVP